MQNLFLSDLEHVMRRQLIEDMAAQLRLGKPFHSAKGCIKFEEPREWFGCPVIQIDFCLCAEFDNVQIIMWLGRKPDEDDFIAQPWIMDSWNSILAEAIKLNFRKKGADHE